MSIAISIPDWEILRFFFKTPSRCLWFLNDFDILVIIHQCKHFSCRFDPWDSIVIFRILPWGGRTLSSVLVSADLREGDSRFLRLKTWRKNVFILWIMSERWESFQVLNKSVAYTPPPPSLVREGLHDKAGNWLLNLSHSKLNPRRF